MTKSKVIRAVVDDEVSLAQSLSRLQVIAHDAKNTGLEGWAERELVGYDDTSEVPDYRRTTSYSFVYSGMNNYVNKVQNLSLDPSYIGDEMLDSVANIAFTQSVSALEEMLEESSGSVELDRSLLAGLVEKNSDGRIQCFAIGQIVPRSFIQNALSQIKNRTLKALIALEEEYGSLDGMDVSLGRRSIGRIQQVNRKINGEVLRIQVDQPEASEEPVKSKVAWNVIAPIITAVASSLLTALLMKAFGF